MATRHRRVRRVALYSAVLAASASLVASRSEAQSTIGYMGGTYTQNFDGLPNSGVFALVGNGPHDLQSPPISAANVEGWSLVKYAGGGANATFVVSSGTSTAGAVYSFGAAADIDRALGSLASGSVQSRFGAIFINNTPGPLNQFNLSYVGEQWRRGGSGVANTLSFEYALGAPDINTGPFLTAPALNFTSPNTVGAGSALNGNDPANQVSLMGTVSGFDWMPGQALVIRWTDVDDGGSDDGLGIDNLAFSASFARKLIWNPAGPGGNTWTTGPAAMNWLDGGASTSFNDGDIVNFTDSGVGMVIIDGAGVAPGATNVSNDTGMYSFVGGAIGGSGALTKTGNGILLLDNVNTYTGGTVVNDGVLQVKFDANLGHASGGVTLGGGIFQTLGTVNSSRALTLTDSTTSIIDTQGPNNASFSSASGGGSLIKQGSGVLTFNGVYGTTGETSVLAGTLVLNQPSGTANLRTGPGGSDFAGDLNIANAIRVNLNGGVFSGGGKIRVQSSGAIISTDGAQQMLSSTVGNDVQLNSNALPAPFSTTIGATINNSIAFNGIISGNSDVSFSSSTPGAGTGVIVLGNQNTWMGTTTVNFAQAGVVRLGTNNALPISTDLVFGTGMNNAGALDLAGFDQSVSSLRSDTTGIVNGIASTAPTLRGTPATLTVTGDLVSSFSGTIGVPPNTTNLPGANDNIAIVLAGTHSGELTLTGANTYAGGTTINGGALGVLNDGNLGSPGGAINFGGGTLRIKEGGFNSNRHLVMNSGGGTVDTFGFDAQTTGPIDGPGTLTKAGAGQLLVTAVRSGGLNVDQGELKVQISPLNNDPVGISDVQTLQIAGGPLAPTARIDLGNNAMIIGETPTDGGPEVETAIRGYISSGYAGGSWGGDGIASSSADFGAGQFALGYADAGQVGIVTFMGNPVLPTDTIIRFTRFGDANIDGIVNLLDFNRLAANFGSTNATWRQGDFNYDSIVNLADFNRLAANFGQSAGPDGPTPQDWANLASVVPEPSTLALASLGALMLVRRRRVK